MQYLKLFLFSFAIIFVLDGCTSSTDPGEEESATEYSLTVSTNPTEGGTANPSEDTFEDGTEVTVEATPNESWSFSAWSGDIESDNNPLTFTINGDTELTAEFSEKSGQDSTVYSLSISSNPSQGGTVEPSDSSYEADSEVTVEAVPNDGWGFDSWSGDIKSEENPLSFTIESDTELTANFTDTTSSERTNYNLAVSTDPSDWGSVTPSSGTFESDTEVTIEANPSEGYNFSEWTGDQRSTENPLTFAINEDTEITAVFAEQQPTEYNLEVLTSPSDGGSVSPSSGTYEEGAEVTVEAMPNEGWNFTGWSGDIKSEENPFSFNISSDTDITANFKDQRSSYTVKLQVIDKKDTLDLNLGQTSNATKQFDEKFDVEAPPPPPSGVLHAYLDITNYNLFQDFRSNLATQVKWSMKYQVGTGQNLTLEWAINESTQLQGNLILTNENNSFEVDMVEQDSHTINSTTSGTLIFRYKFD